MDEDLIDRAERLLHSCGGDGESMEEHAAHCREASLCIQLWYAQRIQKFEQAQEEWQRKQRENTPPPSMMPHPGYVGF